MAGAEHEGRGPRLTALGMQDDATRKILAALFFPLETTFGYLCLLRQLLRRHGVQFPDFFVGLVEESSPGFRGHRLPLPFCRSVNPEEEFM